LVGGSYFCDTRRNFFNDLKVRQAQIVSTISLGKL